MARRAKNDDERPCRKRRLSIELLEARCLLAADFGDAPDPYPTLAIHNGAQHATVGPQLGTTRDAELTGQPTINADGDDSAQLSDEDGVEISPLRVGQLGATALVQISDAPAGARLDAWIDFSGDGYWDSATERIASNLPVHDGENLITFDVPATAVRDLTYARFRLSTAGDLSPAGFADDGEVEDYAVTVGGAAPFVAAFVSQPPVINSTLERDYTQPADLDRDGDMDFVSITEREGDEYVVGYLAWHENNGHESFTRHNLATDEPATALIVADFDGDNDVDIVAVFEEGAVRLYSNNGDATFTESIIGEELDKDVLEVGDFDGDRDVDLVLGDTGSGWGGVRWLENQGPAGFVERVVTDEVPEVDDFDRADIDSDGDLDFVSATDNSNIGVNWYQNDGSGNFTTHAISGERTNHVQLFDMDSDGDLDIVAAGDELGWYANNGSANFQYHVIDTENVLGMAVADVDGDGDQDLSAVSDESGVYVFINVGDNRFDQLPLDFEEYPGRDVNFVDVDQDGRLDIVTGSGRWYRSVVAVTKDHHRELVAMDVASRATWATESAGGSSGDDIVVSANGRFVAFTSYASNLASGWNVERAEHENIYRYDRLTGEIVLVSVNKTGDRAANGSCYLTGVSDDGNVVLFSSSATNLHALDTEDDTDYFVRDIAANTTRLVNLNAAGDAKVDTQNVQLSADGSRVVFSSDSNDLHPLDHNSLWDVFVRDLATDDVQLVSVNAAGTAAGNGQSSARHMSADGNVVVFQSAASNIDPLGIDKSSGDDLYARNLAAGTTELVSINASGTSGSNTSFTSVNTSNDGRFVVFATSAKNLHATDQNNNSDVFVRDLDSNTSLWTSNGFSFADNATISAGGNVVMFTVGFVSLYAYDIASQTTSLVTVNSAGTGGVNHETWLMDISADGNLVLFASRATNVHPLDTDQSLDLYLRNRAANTTKLLTINAQGNDNVGLEAGIGYQTGSAAMAIDGSVVYFSTPSEDVVAGDWNFGLDVFAYEVSDAEVQLVSRAAPGLDSLTASGSSAVSGSAVSGDGRYVVFASQAVNLVSGILMPHDVQNVYRYDRVTGVVALVSVNVAGTGGGDRDSFEPSISADGNVIAFTSQATNLHANDTNFQNDVFARNMATGTTYLLTSQSTSETGSSPVVSADGNVVAFLANDIWAFNLTTGTAQRVSVDRENGQEGANATVSSPKLSADGRIVVFHTAASNLHPLDTNGIIDVYARDLATATTYLISMNALGTGGGDATSLNPVISGDGTVVAFESYARNLHPLESDSTSQSADLDVFARNLATETTYLVSVNRDHSGSGNRASSGPQISADGRIIAFESDATNIIPLDTKSDDDIYAFDLHSGVMHWISDDFSTFGSEDGDEDDFDDGNWDAYNPMISGDGSIVVYIKGDSQIAARNLITGRTQLLTLNRDGTNWANGSSDNPSISADGSVVVFDSDASDFVDGDFNWDNDVFVAAITWQPPALEGDYNNDGYVDAGDYIVWRKMLGKNGAQYAGADGDGDRTVDAEDLAVWRANFGKHSDSIHIVDTLEDESDGDFSAGHYSLREAIEQANVRPGADTIEFGGSLTAAGPAAILLSGGELVISDWLTINGSGAEALTIDAQHQSRIFNITQISGDVALRGLTLTGGRTTGSGEYYDDLSYAGGTIRSFTLGRLTITGSTIRDSRTLGVAAAGGAILSVGELEIVDSIISESGTNGQSANGGAVMSYGPLRLVGSSVTNSNTLGEYSAGGGIFTYGEALIYDSTISGNSTALGRGGGIATDDVVVYGSTISNNRAQDEGGGIATYTTAIVIDSVISGNSTNGEDGRGGGIAAGKLTLLGSTVVGNRTYGNDSHGGGIRAGQLTMDASIVSGNQTIGANSRGGGIEVGDQAIITDSHVAGNSTAGANSPGGGIFARRLTLMQSTISGNHTEGGNSHGGGIRLYSTSSVQFSTITDNHAHSADATGGGISMFAYSSSPVRTLTVTGSIVAGNAAGGENPEIRPAQNLIVRYSLVGNSAGTGLVEAPVGAPDGNGNLIGGPLHGAIDPMLAPLSDNLGPTMTHAILPGSPAIDAGDPSILYSTGEFDQRGSGYARVSGGRIDIGAFEAQQAEVVLPGDYNHSRTVDAGDYVLWRRTLGPEMVTPYSGANGDGNGAITGGDLNVWRENFGAMQPPGSGPNATRSTFAEFLTQHADTEGNVPFDELSSKANTNTAKKVALNIFDGSLTRYAVMYMRNARSNMLRITETSGDDSLLLLAIDRAGKSSQHDSPSIVDHTSDSHKTEDVESQGLADDSLAVVLAAWY